MRKNNYYNFSALLTYEADVQPAPVNSMDFDDRIFFPGIDDAHAYGTLYVLQQAGLFPDRPNGLFRPWSSFRSSDRLSCPDCYTRGREYASDESLSARLDKKILVYVTGACFFRDSFFLFS